MTQSIDITTELETLLSIQRGLEDISEGRIPPAEKVFKEIKENNEDL